MSGVEIPMAGLFNFAAQLGALVEEFQGMAQSNEAVQAAIDMPWMDGTMQHASSDFEGSWDSQRAELLDQLVNYMASVQGVLERWAGYDSEMGMSFEEYLANTPEGKAKLDEIHQATAEGDALWPGTQQKADVDRQTAELQEQIENMSPEELQAYMHDNNIPMDENDPDSVPPHPDDDPLFAEPPADGTPQAGQAPTAHDVPDTIPEVLSNEGHTAPSQPQVGQAPTAQDVPDTIPEVLPEGHLTHPVDPSFDPATPPVSGDAAVAPSDSPQLIPEKPGGDFGPVSPQDGTGLGDLLTAFDQFTHSVQGTLDSGTAFGNELHSFANTVGFGSDFGSAFIGTEPAVDQLVGQYNEFAGQNQLPLVSCDDVHTLLGTQR